MEATVHSSTNTEVHGVSGVDPFDPRCAGVGDFGSEPCVTDRHTVGAVVGIDVGADGVPLAVCQATCGHRQHMVERAVVGAVEYGWPYLCEVQDVAGGDSTVSGSDPLVCLGVVGVVEQFRFPLCRVLPFGTQRRVHLGHGVGPQRHLRHPILTVVVCFVGPQVGAVVHGADDVGCQGGCDQCPCVGWDIDGCACQCPEVSECAVSGSQERSERDGDAFFVIHHPCRSELVALVGIDQSTLEAVPA